MKFALAILAVSTAFGLAASQCAEEEVFRQCRANIAAAIAAQCRSSDAVCQCTWTTEDLRCYDHCALDVSKTDARERARQVAMDHCSRAETRLKAAAAAKAKAASRVATNNSGHVEQQSQQKSNEAKVSSSGGKQESRPAQKDQNSSNMVTPKNQQNKPTTQNILSRPKGDAKEEGISSFIGSNSKPKAKNASEKMISGAGSSSSVSTAVLAIAAAGAAGAISFI
ncbi:hypothetical protein H4219_000942 [Mycoemilia scoparia]|uniref:Uncharacterized protein n=1 Tax=Mycoemilia scoparia TaxID=417184 RepID=A0A9W8A7E2_9FUNG|nr:hypothetical protein H4219_000942 [Mycoemilia scoparia]